MSVVTFDPLGTGRSDVPADTSLWSIERYTEEVEMVRKPWGGAGSTFWVTLGARCLRGNTRSPKFGEHLSATALRGIAIAATGVPIAMGSR
ncbi:hypothetical protein [Roseobacter sp. N2S]|uniref:hypothetical protein n=1 Tax=Roseobacter sp. N2S TaxID=2663844 RepID=UPI0028548CCE|nr:hypothetical protein [Roseobacter sp. N2S]MDR6266802.1 hypothetical protein [Roseobacter sp. N2S]